MNYIFDSNDLPDIKAMKSAYKNFGVIILKNFFSNDSIYEAYDKDLKKIIKLAYKHQKYEVPNSNKIKYLRENSNSVLGSILDLGSKNNKILSGIKLKSSDKIVNIVKSLLGSDLIGTMSVSDRLIMATNLKKENKWWQNIHMDYNYVMQTKESLTAHIGLGTGKNNGGVGFYLKSHKIKNLPLYIDDHGFHQIEKDFFINNIEKKYTEIEFLHLPKSIIFFDSRLLHYTIKNTSNKIRMTQIFRYSNLKSQEAISKNWVGVEPKKNGDNYFKPIKY
jgi:ectoine hydroxylase-related dioxygenase (phytanoyl-CoA dioxygenase family)